MCTLITHPREYIHRLHKHKIKLKKKLKGFWNLKHFLVSFLSCQSTSWSFPQPAEVSSELSLVSATLGHLRRSLPIERTDIIAFLEVSQCHSSGTFISWRNTTHPTHAPQSYQPHLIIGKHCERPDKNTQRGEVFKLELLTASWEGGVWGNLTQRRAWRCRSTEVGPQMGQTLASAENMQGALSLFLWGE